MTPSSHAESLSTECKGGFFYFKFFLMDKGRRGGWSREGMSFLTRGRCFADASRSVSQDDHSQSHHSSSHGNGRHCEGVDKMETEEEGAMSLIDGVCVHVWDLCQLSKFVIHLLA